MSLLRKDFIERRLGKLTSIPAVWQLGLGNFFQLDLKMCQIRSLKYDFQWGSEIEPVPKVSSIIEQPSRILKLDLSLNDLTSLDHEGLVPFRNTRALDASLNRIERIVGIEVLQHLRQLNLSHNLIKRLDGMDRVTMLVELNLGMNELEDISLIPNLSNLTVLHVNNNKLKSLDGVQSLSHLRELYAQRNELTDIMAVSSSFHLTVLNVADNGISSLSSVVSVVRGLHQLQSLCLHGNPVDRDSVYQTRLLESSNLITLDNVNVRPQPKAVNTHSGNLSHIRESAKLAFEEQLRAQKDKMQHNVRFLQKRILALQQDYQEYEDKMNRDLDACLRYLDGLSLEQVKGYDPGDFRDRLASPLPKPWEEGAGPRRAKRDYSNVRNTDELLRNVQQELSYEAGQGGNR